MSIKFDHALTFVWTKDLNNSTKFYSEILGFTKDYENNGWIELSVPGLKDTYIALNFWAKQEEPPINQFITLRVTNLDEFYSYLKSNDVKIVREIEEFLDEGQGMSMFKFSDPDGNILTAAQIIN